MVKHKTFGMGKVINKMVVGGFPCITVQFDSGKQMHFAIPVSFETGLMEAFGPLKDEVAQAIADRKARFASITPTRKPIAAARRRPIHTIPAGPIPAAFEKYLIKKGYKVKNRKGNPSTVTYYLNAVESVRTEEGISWDTLKNTVSSIVPQYDAGGTKELLGAYQHKTVINALKRFSEFALNP